MKKRDTSSITKTDIVNMKRWLNKGPMNRRLSCHFDHLATCNKCAKIFPTFKVNTSHLWCDIRTSKGYIEKVLRQIIKEKANG